MAELRLEDVPPRLMAELREWAQLRRTTLELAAHELLRVGLHAVRDRGQELPAGLDVTDKGTRH